MAWLSSEFAADHAGSSSPSHPDQRMPRNGGTFGMILVLLSLGILFAASLVGFLIFRFGGATAPINEATHTPMAPPPPPLGQLHLPHLLWLSTGIMLISSMTIHRALQSVQREKQLRFRRALLATLALAVGFLLIQAPAMVSLLADRYGGSSAIIYGLIFTLVLIHALHVIGGIIPLGVITYRARHDAYDHEMHQPVSHMVMYWHFLDVVWIIMFATLLIGQ